MVVEVRSDATLAAEFGGLRMSVQTPSPGEIVQGLDLDDVDWADVDVTGATFADCRILNGRFSNTVLESARFVRCHLVGCRMSHVEARDCVFESCVLTDGETHKGLEVAFSRFEGAKLVGCDLSFSSWERSGLYGIDMADCNLRGARFPHVDFSKSFGRKVVRTAAAFRRCNFHLADLHGLSLRGCDLEGSLFRDADLSGADLEEANMIGADLFGATVAGARFAHADLRRAEISGLDLVALASWAGLKITPDQQSTLLAALGIDVHAS